MKTRIEKSATISLHRPIEHVFPLFGPVREKDWAHAWDPAIVYPKDCLVAKHMIFQTRGGLHGSQETYTWAIVNYEPTSFFIEYMVSASERVWFITVKCITNVDGTLATVTYSYTGLTPEGCRRNENAINDIFSTDLKDWEDAINYYLATGKQLVN
jgi:hypothetical protein